MNEVYLAGGLRSPIGKFGGALMDLRATEIASPVAAELLDRTGLPRSAVDQVIGGMVLQDMSESNPARIVGQRIGLPDATPAFTVNMQCASGMTALILAAQQVALGAADCILALGMESMSNPPYVLTGARFGSRSGPAALADALEQCKFAGSVMWGDPWNMIDVAEHHAAVDGISRAAMDENAARSHRRAVAAADAGRFDDEIVPVEAPARPSPVVITADENPRRNVTPESLGRLRPVRSDGVVTAGNASAHNDGAAAALVCSGAAVAAHGLQPLAKIVTPGLAMAGCEPRLMGYSAVVAAEAALAGAGLSLDDIDLIECNEGFAVQMVACERMGKWPADRVNVDGGSVALGHPVGMSGLRIAIHLAHALHQRDLGTGLATVPAGSGLGAAVILQRVGDWRTPGV